MNIIFTSTDQKINKTIRVDDNLSPEQIVKVVRTESVKLKNEMTNSTKLCVKSHNTSITLNKKEIDLIERVMVCEDNLLQEFNFKD